MAAHLDKFPALRLVLCGPPESAVLGLPETVRERVDYLGQLTPEATRDFVAALDIGLLPLDDNPFNQSRFPIKFSEHLATGVPLLCSMIGECRRLVPRFAWAVPAGTTRPGMGPRVRYSARPGVAGRRACRRPAIISRESLVGGAQFHARRKLSRSAGGPSSDPFIESASYRCPCKS